MFIFCIFRENSRQQSRGKSDLGSFSKAYFPGAIFKPVPFLLPPEVNTSCVSGLLTPANSFPKIIRSVFMLGLDLKKGTFLFWFGGFCWFVGFCEIPLTVSISLQPILSV